MVLGSRGISAILCIANNLEEWKSKCADAQVSRRHFSKEVSESISVLEFGSIGKLKQPAQVLRRSSAHGARPTSKQGSDSFTFDPLIYDVT